MDTGSTTQATPRRAGASTSAHTIHPTRPPMLPTRYRNRNTRPSKMRVGAGCRSNNTAGAASDQVQEEEHDAYEVNQETEGGKEDKDVEEEIEVGGHQSSLNGVASTYTSNFSASNPEENVQGATLPDFRFPAPDVQRNGGVLACDDHGTSSPPLTQHHHHAQPMEVAGDGLRKMVALKENILVFKNFLAEVTEHPTRSSLTHKGKDLVNHLETLCMQTSALHQEMQTRILFAGIDKARIDRCFAEFLYTLSAAILLLEDVNVLGKAVKREKSRSKVTTAIKALKAECFTFFGNMTKEISKDEIQQITRAMSYLNRCELAWTKLLS